MPTETRIELVIAFLLAVAIVAYGCLTTAVGRCWSALARRAAAPGHAAKRLRPWRSPWPWRQVWRRD